MDGVAVLRTFAGQHGRRMSKCLVFDPNFDEPLSAAVKLSLDDARVVIRASSKDMSFALQVNTRLVFSVGAPDKVSARTPPAFTSRTGLTVFVKPPAVPEVMRWLDQPDHARFVAELQLGPGDAVHVLRREITFRGRARPLDDAFISSMLKLRGAIAAFPDVPEPPLDVSMLPPELGAFVLQFQGLAESDDDRRGDLRAGLNAADREQLLKALAPLLPMMGRYFETLSGPWPVAAIKLSDLGTLAREITLDPTTGRASGTE